MAAPVEAKPTATPEPLSEPSPAIQARADDDDCATERDDYVFYFVKRWWYEIPAEFKRRFALPVNGVSGETWADRAIQVTAGEGDGQFEKFVACIYIPDMDRATFAEWRRDKKLMGVSRVT